MHFKAIEAHLKQNGRLPVNIRVLLEGEEEVGSSNLDDFVKANKAQLAADVVVISDSPMFDRGIPSICYGLRGLAYFQIDVRGTKSDLHSGSFGGAVVNPNMALAQMLAQMKDRGGRIKIPGFYDDVRELSAEEREQWKRLPFNERRYAKDIGAPKLFGESGYTTLERVWARPTFDINGMLGGFTGEGAKTVIPAVAMAKVSMRLVPNQDPDRIAQLFEEYVKKIAPKIRGGQGHAHARRQAVDDRVRQSFRAGRRARDRERLRQGARLQPRGRFDPGRRDVPGDPRPAVGAVRRRTARRERARAEREARSRRTSTAASSPPRISTTKSRESRDEPAAGPTEIPESGLFTISSGAPNLCRNPGGRVTQERRQVPRYRIESTIAVGDGIGRTRRPELAAACASKPPSACAPGETVAIVFPFERTRPRGLGAGAPRAVVRVEPRGDLLRCRGDLRAGGVQRAGLSGSAISDPRAALP